MIVGSGPLRATSDLIAATFSIQSSPKFFNSQDLGHMTAHDSMGMFIPPFSDLIEIKASQNLRAPSFFFLFRVVYSHVVKTFGLRVPCSSAFHRNVKTAPRVPSRARTGESASRRGRAAWRRRSVSESAGSWRSEPFREHELPDFGGTKSRKGLLTVVFLLNQLLEEYKLQMDPSLGLVLGLAFFFRWILDFL